MEALPLLQRSRAYFAERPGAEYPDSLRSLALAYFRLDRNEEALATARQAIAVARERGERESEMFSQDSLTMLLDNLGKTGLLAPAQRAYELATQIFPDSDRQRLGMQQTLAQAQLQEGDARAGLALMNRTVEDFRRVVGGDHNILGYALWQLGRDREQTGGVRGPIAPLRESLQMKRHARPNSVELALAELSLAERSPTPAISLAATPLFRSPSARLQAAARPASAAWPPPAPAGL